MIHLPLRFLPAIGALGNFLCNNPSPPTRNFATRTSSASEAVSVRPVIFPRDIIAAYLGSDNMQFGGNSLTAPPPRLKRRKHDKGLSSAQVKEIQNTAECSGTGIVVPIPTSLSASSPTAAAPPPTAGDEDDDGADEAALPADTLQRLVSEMQAPRGLSTAMSPKVGINAAHAADEIDDDGAANDMQRARATLMIAGSVIESVMTRSGRESKPSDRPGFVMTPMSLKKRINTSN